MNDNGDDPVDPPTWSCSVCKFDNKIGSMSCEMCNAGKNNGVTSIQEQEMLMKLFMNLT